MMKTLLTVACLGLGVVSTGFAQQEFTTTVTNTLNTSLTYTSVGQFDQQSQNPLGGNGAVNVGKFVQQNKQFGTVTWTFPDGFSSCTLLLSVETRCTGKVCYPVQENSVLQNTPSNSAYVCEKQGNNFVLSSYFGKSSKK